MKKGRGLRCHGLFLICRTLRPSVRQRPEFGYRRDGPRDGWRCFELPGAVLHDPGLPGEAADESLGARAGRLGTDLHRHNAFPRVRQHRTHYKDLLNQ